MEPFNRSWPFYYSTILDYLRTEPSLKLSKLFGKLPIYLEYDFQQHDIDG